MGIALRSTRSRGWRLWVAAVGIVVSLGAAYLVHAAPGVYWARTVVRLYPPDSGPVPNVLQADSGPLVQVAGIVARHVEPTLFDTMPVSPDVTLPDQGVRDGSRVFQANVGGQWQANFVNPALIVDVVAPSPTEVTTRTQTLVREIQGSLKTMQQAEGVKSRAMITAQPILPRPQVVHSGGGSSRAALLTLLLGLGLTRFVVSCADRLAARHPRGLPLPSRRRRAAGAVGTTA